MEQNEIKHVLEAALLAAGRPLPIAELHELFPARGRPEKRMLRDALRALETDYEGRGIRLKEVGSGFRIEVRPEMSERLTPLWEERAPRYSRALFETLALIAYRQPITRGEIEEVRGVSVSTNIVRTLLEREWVRVVGHRDVPGKPAMFGTTRTFLDYFGLKSLDDLPPLSELTDIESLRVQLDLPEVDEDRAVTAGITRLHPERDADSAADETAAETRDAQAEEPDDDETVAAEPAAAGELKTPESTG